MPHINRLRLVNVNFNDAKGIYDNFKMRLDGKSTTYDLINSGGKSVLLLMLLQTVLPNTYLKSDRPLKNIFLGWRRYVSNSPLIIYLFISVIPPKKKCAAPQDITGIDQRYKISSIVIPEMFPLFIPNTTNQNIRKNPLLIIINTVWRIKLFLYSMLDFILQINDLITKLKVFLASVNIYFPYPFHIH